MAAVSQRGDALLLAHCASLDPAAPPARRRLEEALGEELSHTLVRALCSGPARRQARLDARAVFAA